MSDYTVDDEATGVLSPVGAKDLSFSHCLQTSSRPIQPCIQWVPRVLFLGIRRTLHSEELHNLYPFLNIITPIKSMRMRWAGHVAHMGEESVQFGSKTRRKETTWKAKA
jgi:hypothetical protein